MCMPLSCLGDQNGPRHKWLGSTTTNRHGVAAFNFATVPGCYQLVVGLTHARSGTLDFLMTDVPDLVQIAVTAPISNTDTVTIIGAVCGAIRDQPCRNIWSADNPVEHLSLLAGCCVPTKFNLMHNKITNNYV